MTVQFTYHKNQIRPRSFAVTLNNDAIKALGSNSVFEGGMLRLTPVPATVDLIILDCVVIMADIVVAYGGINDGAQMQPAYALTVAPPYSLGELAGFFIEDRAALSYTNITDLLTTVGQNSFYIPSGAQHQTSKQSAAGPPAVSIAGVEIIETNGNTRGRPLILNGTNGGGTDYTLGSASNAMKIITYYWEITS